MLREWSRKGQELRSKDISYEALGSIAPEKWCGLAWRGGVGGGERWMDLRGLQIESTRHTEIGLDR